MCIRDSNRLMLPTRYFLTERHVINVAQDVKESATSLPCLAADVPVLAVRAGKASNQTLTRTYVA